MRILKQGTIPNVYPYKQGHFYLHNIYERWNLSDHTSFKIITYCPFHTHLTQCAEFKMQWPEDKEVSPEVCGRGAQDC